MSADEQKVIHAALESTKGDIPAAAVILGMTGMKLHNRINRNKFLKDFWGKGVVNVPSEAATVNRPVMPPAEYIAPPLPTDEEIAAAIEKEDKLVQKGLEKCNLPEDLTKLALGLRQFQGRHFRSSIDMIGGGITVQYLRVMAEVQAIDDELKTPLTPAREMLLREDRSRLLDVMSKFYDRAQKAVMVSAKIKQMENGSTGGDKRSAKPGFAPLKSANPK